MTENLPATVDAKLPVTYEAAKQALAECVRVDEAKEWSDKAQALASYARQAKDESLRNMALRIHDRATRRVGELLQQIPSASVANLVQHRQAGNHPSENHRRRRTEPAVTRTQAAADAGLSDHQRKNALRAASIPREEFDALVESDTPPTVTELAARGTARRPPSPSADIPGADAATTARAHALLRDLAAFCATHDAAAVARGIADPALARGFTATIESWTKRFVTSLESRQA